MSIKLRRLRAILASRTFATTGRSTADTLGSGNGVDANGVLGGTSPERAVTIFVRRWDRAHSS
jgi:hypothetical protein